MVALLTAASFWLGRSCVGPTIAHDRLTPSHRLEATVDVETPDVEIVPGTCHVYAVLASDEGGGAIPENLEFMTPWLTDEPLNQYGSFRLIDAQIADLELGGRASIELETGHRMWLELRAVENEVLEFHLELTRAHAEGDRQLVSADYRIGNAAMLWLQAGAYTLEETSGRVFLASRCVRKPDENPR